ncbi:unnamed protein product [Owenia fusiformis]|uniref:Uncharacterized protein n=1 Tax=Owenia fusiformis TaxID=6347 RepID=A0A8J1UPX0_OWEFU|nr:unnamed protein product [Owenia fusiformis]
MSYEEFFNEADTDGTGSLTFKELKDVLVKKGYKGDTESLRNIFDAADSSDDNTITLDEFMEAMSQTPPAEHTKARYRELFKGFDHDGSGQITREELSQVFDEMGRDLSEEEVARIIQLADEDGSGTLNYDELIEHCFGEQ